jgi:hypothetical protein
MASGATLMVTYAPRCFVHADRYGVTKSGPTRLFVLHTSEGGELTSSAEALCSLMGRPGDRPSGSGFYGSSYQYVTDTDCIRPVVKETVVSYSAAGANHDGIHICFPGRAGQTEAQWLDVNSRMMIRQCAELLCDRTGATGIPLRQLYDSEVRAGMSGVCDHATISRVYRKSDHTDVGQGFPWHVLWADVASILNPPTPDPDPEDDMAVLLVKKRPPEGSPPHWPWLGYFDNGTVRPLISNDPMGEAPLEYILDAAQYRNAAHAAGCAEIVG